MKRFEPGTDKFDPTKIYAYKCMSIFYRLDPEKEQFDASRDGYNSKGYLAITKSDCNVATLEDLILDEAKEQIHDGLCIFDSEEEYQEWIKDRLANEDPEKDYSEYLKMLMGFNARG